MRQRQRGWVVPVSAHMRLKALGSARGAIGDS